MKLRAKRRFTMIATIVCSLVMVAIASVATFAWFQINSSASPEQATQTRSINTSTIVHQNNTHSNDDSYQTSPIQDAAGTLGYDHSKGGKATNFYIRQWDNSGNETTLQMYTNHNNTDDRAVYYNVKFSNKWKIYDAAKSHNSKDYYGYDDIDEYDPLLDLCGSDGDGNITIGSLTGYYDVYVTDRWTIWIVNHTEQTTSDEVGNETGYYIYGDAADSKSSLNGHDNINDGIPMYVNAAANTSDRAFYAGLRLSVGDVFYVASGDSTSVYTSKDASGSNLLNNASYFTFSSGTITCNQLGYYSIALNSSDNLFVEEWDGKEADGSTHYTANDGSGNYRSSQSNNKATPKESNRVTRESKSTDSDSNLLIRVLAPQNSGFSADSCQFGMEIWNSGNTYHAAPSDWLGKNNDNNWNVIKLNGSTDYWYSEVSIDKRNWLNNNGVTMGRYKANDTSQRYNYANVNSGSGVFYNMCTYDTSGNAKSATANSVYVANATTDNFGQSNKGFIYKIRMMYKTSIGNSYTQYACAVYDSTHTYTFPTPSAPTGYVFAGWYTDSDCTVSAGTNLKPTEDVQLYAKYTVEPAYLNYDSNGFDTAGGTTTSTANTSSTSTTVTWSNITMAAGSGFYLSRSGSYWHADCINTGSTYFGEDSTNDKNFKCYYAGTYTITLTLLSGDVDIAMNSIDPTQFYVTDTAGNTLTSDVCTTTNSLSFTINNVRIPKRGTLFHVRDGKSSGYSVFGGVSGTTTVDTNYTFVTTSSLSNEHYNLSALYACYVNIVFTLTGPVTSCRIVANSVETYYPSQFMIYSNTRGTTVGSGATYSSSVFTLSSIELKANEEFGVRTESASTTYCNHGLWAYPQLSLSSLTVNGTASCTSSDYFAQGTNRYDGKYYIKAKYHGVYSFTFNLDSNAITAATITLDSDNFKMVGYGYSFGQYARSYDSADAIYSTASDGTNTLTFDSLYLKIQDNFKFLDGGGVYCGFSNITNDSATNNYIQYLKADGSGNITSRVDLNITMTLNFNPRSPGSSAITLGAATENTDIRFDHAENAGIYVEVTNTLTAGVPDWSVSTKTMMHTTSGIDSQGHTYLAQESPFYSRSGTYLRVYKTHSNGSSTVPTDSTIRELTEYYYVAQDSPQAGFVSSTSDHSPTGNGKNAYVTVSVTNTWTISLRDDGQIHIGEYSGAATESVEHEVPFYLIGRGVPGSDLRNSDFTISKGIALWTYGNNDSTLPCYVGKYGTNTDSSKYVGTGITLKKGDAFALCDISKQIKTFATNPVTGLSINTTTGIVTVTASGVYRIYLTGSVGSESINMAQVSAGSDPARNGTIVAESVSNNTISIGGNIDYSLLDAYNATGYVFEIELSHVSTGAAGTMTYTIQNNNTYSISTAKKDAAYGSGTYSADTVIVGNSSLNTYTRAIAASVTTKTCIRITLTPQQIQSMIASGTYTFNITISYSFVEATIS